MTCTCTVHMFLLSLQYLTNNPQFIYTLVAGSGHIFLATQAPPHITSKQPQAALL